MPNSKKLKKNHIIHFRVSEEELHRLQHHCREAGLRSLSELARLAVRQLVTGGTESPADNLPPLDQMQTAIQELERRVRRCESLLKRGDGSSAQHPMPGDFTDSQTTPERSSNA